MPYLAMFVVAIAGGTLGFLAGAVIEHLTVRALWRYRQRRRRRRVYRCPVCDSERQIFADD